MPHIPTIFLKVIDNRIFKKIENNMDEEQFGFREQQKDSRDLSMQCMQCIHKRGLDPNDIRIIKEL